eukprot:c3447_g1_i1 orf=644-3112(+)
MGEKQDELDPQGWKTSFTQTTEEVARAVVAAAAAVRPRPSIVFTSNNNSSNKTFEKLQRQIKRVWRQGLAGDTNKKAFFNPEHLTSQKRQWTQLQVQMLERKKWNEPNGLFEHMVLVGLHPAAETQALEAALLKKRTWEKELDAPDRLRDVMRQQFRGSSPPMPNPEILYAFPPGKKLPMRQKDLLAFCYPGGVEAHLVERTPSLSELNEIVYGQDHVMRDDLSYIFFLKVADNATLYGVCVYVPEVVKQPPGIMTMNSKPQSRGVPAPLSRFCLTTYRCYCLLTKLPFFDLHFEVLNSIITQERLDRITECVNEMTLSSFENSGAEMGAEVNGVELNGTSPPYPDKNGCTSEQGIDSLPLPELNTEKASDLFDEPRHSVCNNHANSGNGLNLLGEDKPASPGVQEQCVEAASTVIQDPMMTSGHANEEAKTVIVPAYSNGELSNPLKHEEETVSSSNVDLNLQRADSMDSVNSTIYSFRQCATSEDDEAEEASSSGREYNFNSKPELVWAEADHCLLQILYEYYKLPVPARGSSLSFQPLEHLPPLKFTRPANETSTLLGGRTIDPMLCRTTLEMVEMQGALAAAEEATAISIWTVATACRVLSLENVLALFTCVLLEKQIVVVCPNPGVLSAVVLSTIPLMRPFQWQSLMLPILPNQMLDFLDAPVPYVVGVLQKSSIMRAKSSSLAVINVHRDKVSMPYVPPLPHRRELSSALEPFHARLAAEGDFARRHPVHVYNDAQYEAAEGFLAVLRSYLESLCKNLRSHTITNVQSNNDKVSLLLKDSFVEDFESKDQSFMKLFVDTQFFSVHTDAVLSSIESS